VTAAEIDVVRLSAPVNEVRTDVARGPVNYDVRRIEVRPGVWVREVTRPTDRAKAARATVTIELPPLVPARGQAAALAHVSTVRDFDGGEVFGNGEVAAELGAVVPAHPPLPATETIYEHTRKVLVWVDRVAEGLSGRTDIASDEIATLGEVLPERKWWLLYLDPRDHVQAVDLDPTNPGGLYDRERSPGFQPGMVVAYRSVLDDRDVIAQRVDWHEYQRMHLLATRHVRANTADKSYFDITGTAGERIFHYVGTDEPAADLLTEELAGRPLVSTTEDVYLTDEERGHVKLSESRSGAHWAMDPVYDPADVPALVDAVFDGYYAELSEADGEHDRLRAIGRAVRSLHVLHLFGDGNGRLNVYFLLPRLLLANGFRPVVVPSMSYLFSGGFTLDQIATVLRWGQEQDLATEGTETIPDFAAEPEPDTANDEEATYAPSHDPSFCSTAADRQRFRRTYSDYELHAVGVREAMTEVEHLSHVAEEDLVAVAALANGDFHEEMNRALRTGDRTGVARYDAHIRTITSGLNQLPAHQGAVLRTMHVPAHELNDVAARYAPGTVPQENGFTSSALTARQFGDENVVFTIHSTTGRRIADLFEQRELDEVVFTPASRFKVVTRQFRPDDQLDGGGMWLFGLIEHGAAVEPSADLSEYDLTTNAMVLVDQAGLVEPLTTGSVKPEATEFVLHAAIHAVMSRLEQAGPESAAVIAEGVARAFDLAHLHGLTDFLLQRDFEPDVLGGVLFDVVDVVAYEYTENGVAAATDVAARTASAFDLLDSVSLLDRFLAGAAEHDGMRVELGSLVAEVENALLDGPRAGEDLAARTEQAFTIADRYGLVAPALRAEQAADELHRIITEIRMVLEARGMPAAVAKAKAMRR
jgi:hypothetical protein